MFNVTYSPHQVRRGRSDVRDIEMENSMTVTESPSKITTQASNLNIATNNKLKLRVVDRKQSEGRSPMAKHNLPNIGGRV